MTLLMHMSKLILNNFNIPIQANCEYFDLPVSYPSNSLEVLIKITLTFKFKLQCLPIVNTSTFPDRIFPSPTPTSPMSPILRPAGRTDHCVDNVDDNHDDENVDDDD